MIPKIKIILVSAMLLFGSALHAQQANSWIEYSQKYLRIPIHQEGIYSIDQAALNSALLSVGENLNNIDPRNFQVFNLGQEIPIYIVGEIDGSFDANDKITFYAAGNDGRLDTSLYASVDHQAHRYYSLVNDTAAYFLTWNTSTNNRRYRDLNLSSNRTPEPFYLAKALKVYNSNYQLGPLDRNGKDNSGYNPGEGYFSNRYGKGGRINSTLATSDVYSGTGAPNARVQASVVSVSNSGSATINHRTLLKVGTSTTSQTTVGDTSYNGYQLIKFDKEVALANLGANTIVTAEVGALNPDPATDFQAVGHVEIIYPHVCTMTSGTASIKMILPASSDSSRFLITPYFGLNEVYDVENGIRYSGQPGGATSAFVFAPGAEREIFFPTVSTAFDIAAGQISKVSSNGFFTDYSAQNANGAFVIVTHPSLFNSADNYRIYRESAAGGGYNVVLAMVDELYDQFAFGVQQHPLAIRNFADYLLSNSGTPPQYLMLLGKSLRGNLTRKDATNYTNNLVPSFGVPATDNLFTAGLNGTFLQPAFATGRLAARSNTDVDRYLEKLKDYELAQQNPDYTIGNKAWMKEVMHFGGGANASEQGLFRSYLSSDSAILAGPKFGGNVSSYFKNSTAPIQQTQSQTILDRLKEGVSMMNFFGHAGGNSFDISIDDPDRWGNFGKYPVLVANSCFTGGIHEKPSINPSTSEQYVLEPNAGVIAFLASVNLGYPGGLHKYTSTFLTNSVGSNYNQSIGKVIQQTIVDLAPQSINDDILRNTFLEMTLHGDPALKINSHEKPDYAIEKVTTEPEQVTTLLDKFKLQVHVTNIGNAIDDSMSVHVTHQLPNGTDTSITLFPKTPFFKDVFEIDIPIDANQAVGLNQFSISLDRVPTDRIPEMDDFLNNVITYEIDITSDELFPIWPYNYAVVPSKKVKLSASTGQPYLSPRQYIFLLDSYDLYDSPRADSFIITSVGGVLSWDPNLDWLADSGVIFWRVAPYPIDPQKPRWREHSFQYIDGKRGWGQAHFHQFKNDERLFLDYDRTTRTMNYLNVVQSLSANIQGIGQPSQATSQVLEASEYRIDGSLQDFSICSFSPAIHVAVIDSLTLKPWETRRIFNQVIYNPANNFGNANDEFKKPCRPGRTDKYFVFNTTVPEQMDSLAAMLNNPRLQGHYLLAYTAIRGDFQTTKWQNRHFQAFENLGASLIRNAPDSVPYAFFTKVGSGTVQEVLGTSANEKINLTATLTNSGDYGFINSTIAGRATKWNSLHWRYSTKDAIPQDQLSLALVGIHTSGREDTLGLYDQTQLDEFDLTTVINGNTHPQAELRLQLSDPANKTAPQLRSWHLLHEQYPEVALNPAGFELWQGDSIQQGEDINWSVDVVNVSDIDMPPTDITYRFAGETANRLIENRFLDSLKAGGVYRDTLQLGSQTFTDESSIIMEVNPIDANWNDEQFHFNNIARRSFGMGRDKLNPLLDVTFDGIHILDGDIISPIPEIKMRLKDDNPYLTLSDTGDFTINLVKPNGNIEPIYFGSTDPDRAVVFTPGELPDNQAEIVFQPNFKTDGTYKLQVTAQDPSGNSAVRNSDNGQPQQYEISFEVIQASTITQVMNYPNPFTTATRFVFTLTGSKVPDYFRIQILTVSGTVVREITQDEFGSIRIGRNISEFVWNGTDEFGDRLANGVYLYRVITEVDGESIENSESGADQFITKGFGKMYLFR